MGHDAARQGRDWGEGRGVVSRGLGFTSPGPHGKAWRQTAREEHLSTQIVISKGGSLLKSG